MAGPLEIHEPVSASLGLPGLFGICSRSWLGLAGWLLHEVAFEGPYDTMQRHSVQLQFGRNCDGTAYIAACSPCEAWAWTEFRQLEGGGCVGAVRHFPSHLPKKEIKDNYIHRRATA